MIYTLDGTTPKIADGVFLAPNSSVIGNVEIAENASVWFGVVIRGDNDLMRIGEGSNIQDNCVLHSDPGFSLTIGRNCTIGHSAIVHGCTIGDGTLIGMGATVLNGAVIGQNCLIGAGALVTEKTVIPDNSLVVGSPARVKRELGKEQIEGLNQSAIHYQENSNWFSEELSSKFLDR
ncbi:gamma carbonic anhydrase family protein [Pelagimonas varians]|uniref:2,3,4,5-tetrahydropyridine-2,6-dicarboxylate N-acetyltransferase n=1 Tax=Pelagimonas varians TaxID=696760 RepID=A0A238JZ27_9RHOB|nr:gamma carbonic anhydrase family protein [Pelagimonas varians]PYG33176.1 carbonic anhydrase/acetyltransferase-like protein (isoleucine patch superfamily) [Pelagimonas varians]SMX35908.1 2,3,4,5-tetrahydropyridine-2,6-dicarboxylate N-acetyltransferase [Pelagimonas varians]